MKEIEVYRNGAYNAEALEDAERETIASGSDWEVLQVNEDLVCYGSWADGIKRHEIGAGSRFLVYSGIAYPLDDSDDIQSWENALFIIEGFGR